MLILGRGIRQVAAMVTYLPVARRILRYAMVSCALGAGPAGADYLLQPGDTVEITVQGVPELKRRSVLREDGYIPFPLIGNINFVELSLVQVRDNIRDILVGRKIVAFPDVTVDLIEVRPLYVLGDVARPGSYPFKPEYTIRHAIALAGGLDAANTRSRGNMFSETADWTADFETQRIELVKQNARIRRLQAELAGNTSVDFGDLFSLSDSDPLYAEIRKAEEQQLSRRHDTRKNDRESYGRSIEQATRQLEALEEQRSVEDQGLRQQSADVERMRALNERGLAPSSRLIEEQRSILLTKARLTSTMAQVASVKKTIEELRRQMDKSEELRQLDAGKELQEALISAEVAQHKLDMIGEKLGSSSELMSRSDRLRFVVYRKVGGKSAQFDADAGTALMPGDVVEATIARRALSSMKSRLTEPTTR
jgi:polysaccharide biosynthesis/export protein